MMSLFNWQPLPLTSSLAPVESSARGPVHSNWNFSKSDPMSRRLEGHRLSYKAVFPPPPPLKVSNTIGSIDTTTEPTGRNKFGSSLSGITSISGCFPFALGSTCLIVPRRIASWISLLSWSLRSRSRTTSCSGSRNTMTLVNGAMPSSWFGSCADCLGSVFADTHSSALSSLANSPRARKASAALWARSNPSTTRTSSVCSLPPAW